MWFLEIFYDDRENPSPNALGQLIGKRPKDRFMTSRHVFDGRKGPNHGMSVQWAFRSKDEAQKALSSIKREIPPSTFDWVVFPD